MPVLVLTAEPDLTADLVIRELNARGGPLFRCDAGDFPLTLTMSARLRGKWTGQLRTCYRQVTFESIHSVYYRRPSRFRFNDDLRSTDRQFAAAEAKLGFGGVLASLSCVWVNHPFRASAAEYKPLQLVAASECGLRTPETLITNDPEEAAAFARSVASSGVVYKALSSGPVADGEHPVVLYTSVIDLAECADPSIGTTAHLFQAWVPKRYDVRVNVVGKVCLAVAIKVPRSSSGHVDWRSDYTSSEYEAIDVPEQVQASIQAMLQRLGLVFGAFDFVVTPEGEWVFLEVNPNGEWGWLEGKAGSIAGAIASVLQDAEEHHG